MATRLKAGMAAIMLTLALSVAPAAAEFRALVAGPAERSGFRSNPAGVAAARIATLLEAAGFEVTRLQAPNVDALRAAFSDELNRPPASLYVVFLAGSFQHGATDSWYLASDADRPDLATIGAQAIDLDLPLQIAASTPGGALVMLGASDDGGRVGPGLRPGIGELEVPQGVSVVRGDPARLQRLAETGLLEPGKSIAEAVQGQSGIEAEGFLATRVAFLSEALVAQRGDEARAWADAVRANTEVAYQGYLAAYPAGRNAQAAREALERLVPPPSPEELALAAENALGLSRDDRREIQRALSLLGYNPRGVDGIFGPGSRGAIRAWQGAQGLDVTGHVTTRESIGQLLAQAARRAADLEAEAQARREAEERADRLFWTETGARGDEAGLRAYLRRYPDGAFSDLARDRVSAIDADRANAAAARDRAAWDIARAGDTVDAYRVYLSEFPQGAFAQAANDRIAAISEPSEPAPDLDAAAQAESALGLNAITRTLVERRLAAEGLEPGPVDGVFDDETRRALRRFQRARSVPPTGYLDERTLVLLLAGAIGITQ